MNTGTYLPVFGWVIDTAFLNVELEQMSSSDPPKLCHLCYQVPTKFSARTTKKKATEVQVSPEIYTSRGRVEQKLIFTPSLNYLLEDVQSVYILKNVARFIIPYKNYSNKLELMGQYKPFY